MRRLLAALAVLVTLPVFADATVTVTAPASGGPVERYELFVDGVLVGPVVVGSNSFPDLVDAAGTFTFRVDAINQFGRTQSDPQIVAALPPGKPGLTIVVTQPTP
jgi:hypothetical protein